MSDEIEALREASLVHRAEFGDRLRLLDLVRAFGRQLLDAEGETAAAQAAHRSYYATRYADVAADAHPSAPGPVARAMAADHADIRAGIASGVEAGDAHSAVTLTRALQPIWMTGFLEESGAIVDTVLGAFSLPADDELHLWRMVSYANSTRSSHRYWTERRITRAGELGQVGPQVAGLANMLSVAVSRRNMVEAQAVRKQLEPLIESPQLTRRTRAAGLCALVHCALGDGDLDAACRLADRAVEDAESEGALHMLAIARTARLQVVSTRDGVIDKGDLVAVVDGALSVGVPDMSYGALLCGARYVVEFDPAFAAELLAGAEQLATSALEGHLWPESELRDETLRVLGPHVADMLPDLAVAEPLDALTRLQAWLAHRPSDERAVLGRPHATDAPHSSRPAHQP
jgi:hypothetical protein